MQILSGDLHGARRVALLPGSFHPPTVAHLDLGRRALEHADRVVLTMPRALPHKPYEDVSMDLRLQLLQKMTAREPRFAVALSQGGLFIEMARELRLLLPAADISFLCGRDAAERITSWPYDPSEPIERQLEEFTLLVADRQGTFAPPAHLQAKVHLLGSAGTWDDVSSTRVREAIGAGEAWTDMVPASIQGEVEALYSPLRLDSRKARSR